MKHLKYTLIATFAAALASCDYIDGDDRFMTVDPGEADTAGYVKRFIVEDFTGQFCTYCPDAAEMLETLKEETYGERMIIVAMHAGGLALGSDLYNDDAQTYMTALGLVNNPAVSVDRTYNSDDTYSTWVSGISNRSLATTPCEVTQYITKTGDRSFKATAEITFAETVEDSLGVQHWILQDSIIGYQIGHTGLVFDYVHNHVFRACLYDDIWGTPLEGADAGVYMEGETFWSQVSDEYTVPDDWETDKLSIVSFVFRYSTDESNPIAEIIQANKTELPIP